MKKKPPQKRNKSMMQLAAKIGVSRSTLYSWKEAGAPIDKGEGAILEWALAENKRGDSDEIKKARHNVLVETHRSLKLKNDERSTTVLKREQVEADASQAMSLFWQALDEAFGNSLPPMLAGLSAAEISAKLGLQLDKLKSVCRLELSRIAGEKILAPDFEAAKLSIEGRAAMQVCTRRAWDEKLSAEWQSFMDWKRQIETERKAKRRAWCQERAAAGLPVPDATGEEIREHPGLKRQ